MADPITLTAIGLGISGLAGIGGAAAQLANRPKPPAVPSAPPSPAPVQQPQGSVTTPTAGAPSFLAAAAAPQQQNVPGKTLLGQ